MTTVKHPAPYSAPLLPVMAELLQGATRVLDPFAGTGRLVEIRSHGFTGEIHLNEIETEWAALCACADGATSATCGDARSMPWPDDFFDAIATSPTYGNRMADTFVDDTKRITYTAALGRSLSPGSTGDEGWGPGYRQSHREIYTELVRVSRRGARLVLNMSDHIADGERQAVSDWHVRCLESLGYVLRERRDVPTRRNGFGANRNVRVPVEHVFLLTLDGEARPFADLGVDVPVAGGKTQLGLFGGAA